MSTEHMDESAYLELKGMIIDWAEGRAITLGPHMEPKALEPKEVVIMLKRVIKDFEGRKCGKVWKK